MTDDLISRQATIDDICDDWCECKNSQCPHPFKPEEGDYYWCDGCGSVERIKNLPSAQPERKTGRWIVETIRSNWNDWDNCTCSECGKTFYKFDQSNYCPNCGAKMEGDND